MSFIIETENLTKRYRYKDVVNNVSIHISKGEIYGLIGKNGAGKTTLLKLLLGLTNPTSGKIKIFGENPKNENKLKIGSLIEEPGLYKNFTAKENLVEFSLLYGSPIDEVDKLLCLVGLENVGKKKVKAFSLGMKQRLGLAIALLGKPEILILDEPINGLDPEGIVEFRNIIENLNKNLGVTIIISSHLLDELGKVATKYGIIKDGILVEEKTTEEILDVCGSFLKIETNDNSKAAESINKLAKGINAKEINGFIIIKDQIDKRAKINSLLIKEGFEIYSSSVESNDVEKFFVERLK